MGLDAEIKPYLDRINDIGIIISVGCCSGHFTDPEHPSYKYSVKIRGRPDGYLQFQSIFDPNTTFDYIILPLLLETHIANINICLNCYVFWWHSYDEMHNYLTALEYILLNLRREMLLEYEMLGEKPIDEYFKLEYDHSDLVYTPRNDRVKKRVKEYLLELEKTTHEQDKVTDWHQMDRIKTIEFIEKVKAGDDRLVDTILAQAKDVIRSSA